MRFRRTGSIFSARRSEERKSDSRDHVSLLVKCWKPVALLVVTNLLTARVARDSRRRVRSARAVHPSYAVVAPYVMETSSSSHLDKLSAQVGSEFRIAYEQSLGYFDDIRNDAWDVLRRNAMGMPRYVEPSNPNAGAYVLGSPATWLYNNWAPAFSCPRLSKVGGLGDGPKWMCDVDRLARVVERRRAHRKQEQREKQQKQMVDDAHEGLQEDCLVYSIGSNGDYAFEDALVAAIGPLCEVHIFDPGNFERRGLSAHNTFYHKWGLTSSYASSNFVPGFLDGLDMYSFQEIREKLGHTNRSIDVLKIDCEGCEWITYLDWIGEDVRQVLIETHRLPDPGQNLTYKGVVLPELQPSDFFDEFEKKGFGASLLTMRYARLNS